jgi:succinate dehydrogenase/fumarate reductase flavoprotein subunit
MVDYPELDDKNWLHDTILCRHDKTVHSYLLES